MPDRSAFDVIKPEVRSLSVYALRHLGADVKLNQNENPYELPDSLKRQITERILQRPWGRYPEFVPEAVTGALSRFTGWPAAGILVGNGSNELIEACLMVTLAPGRRIVVVQPTFTLYRLLAKLLDATIDEVFLDRETMGFDVPAIAHAAEAADVVVLCSPNNPTGTLLESNDLERIVRAARGIVILDEAYHEFSGQTAVPHPGTFRNLIVLRTFSKAMAMAGLRFGYMMADPELAAEVHKAQLPYNVNIFTLAAAETVIENREVLAGAIQTLIRERGRLTSSLREMPGVRVFPSRANFVLIRTGCPPGELFDRMSSEGVLVRDVSGYPLLEGCLRVSVGRPEENDRFVSALGRALERTP